MTDRIVARTVGSLSLPMRWATYIAGGLAFVATVIPGVVGTAAGVVAVTLIIAAPLVRVAVLVVVWWTERDLRFVYTAAFLLAIIGVGAVIALVS